jgi:hypothetical protein
VEKNQESEVEATLPPTLGEDTVEVGLQIDRTGRDEEHRAAEERRP